MLISLKWYHVAMILLHRPLIPRPRVGHSFVSNAHHKKATEHANRLVDLLGQFAAGQEIDKVADILIALRFPPSSCLLFFGGNAEFQASLTGLSAAPAEQCVHDLYSCYPSRL